MACRGDERRGVRACVVGTGRVPGGAPCALLGTMTGRTAGDRGLGMRSQSMDGHSLRSAIILHVSGWFVG